MYCVLFVYVLFTVCVFHVYSFSLCVVCLFMYCLFGMTRADAYVVDLSQLLRIIVVWFVQVVCRCVCMFYAYYVVYVSFVTDTSRTPGGSPGEKIQPASDGQTQQLKIFLEELKGLQRGET